MRSTQETAGEEGKDIGSRRSLIDLDGLDLHLSSILSSKDRFIKTPTSPVHSFDIYSSDHTGAPTSRSTPATGSEIIVRVDDMDYEMHSPASEPATQDESE